MSLERLQHDFLDALLAPSTPADARMAVYHRSVRANRIGALEAAYPVVRRLVGAAFFEEAAARYADAVPSRAGDLNVYGAGLAGFLATYAHARELPWLADVARLEWAVHESGLAAEGAALDYAALGSVRPERLRGLRLPLRPFVRLVQSAHPVLTIWEANQPERDGTPDRDLAPERVVVRRVGLQAAPVRIDAAQWAVLTALSQGETLTQAAAACAAAGAAFESTLVSLGPLGVLGAIPGPGG